MNDVVKIFKKGHKIHIKESQKGTFTKWCGGNVTDECIQRGKNSSNPKIRKKATFAANARKWKHKEGGIIKASDGTKTNWISNSLGKVGNFLNSDWGKLAASGISSMLGGSNSESSYNNNYSDIMTNTALQYMQNQQQENEVQSNYDKIMSKLHFDPDNPNANGGSIVKNHVNYLAQAPIAAKQKEFNDNYKKFLDEQVKQRKTNYITNALTNTLQTGFDIALNYKPTTKKGSSVS